VGEEEREKEKEKETMHRECLGGERIIKKIPGAQQTKT
jgi:hypothetical protein